MKVGILSTVAWRTPPKTYGSYEWVASTLAEGLIKKNIDVTLFATGDSKTAAKLEWITKHGYEEDKSIEPRVCETMHIANFFENAHKFDIIHNLIDIIPLTYSRLVNVPMVTTFHGIPQEGTLPLYKKYNDNNYYVAISKSAREPRSLSYADVIYHGIDLDKYTFATEKEDFLFCMARIHPDKGIHHAISIAKKSRLKLIIAGIVQDKEYFDKEIQPHIDNKNIEYIGPVGGIQRTNLLSKAKAFIHPLQFPEPFGLSVVEAQASGTPVIAYNKGSMSEVIKDKITGFLVNDVNEAVLAINKLKNINSYDCRNWVKDNFSQEIMSDAYIRLYKRILNQSKH